MIELKECPICGSEGVKDSGKFGLYPSFKANGMFAIDGMTLAVLSKYWMCYNCYVYFQNPRPTPQEIIKFYASGAYRKMLTDVNPDIDFDRDEDVRAKRLMHDYDLQSSAHLDIGCSRGYLLSKVGADLQVGVDLDHDRIEDKSVEVHSSVDSVKDGAFDLVTAVHVLEHVYNPVNELIEWHRKLKVGGRLYIEVPIEGAISPYRLPHLYVFQPWAMDNMLRMAGMYKTSMKLDNGNLGVFVVKES